MHFQAAAHQMVKLIRYTQGAIHIVNIDIRPDLPTFMNYFAIDLTADSHNALCVLEGFVHGFLNLESDTCVFYQMSKFQSPGYEGGFRWNEPAFNIRWPVDINMISECDANYLDFSTDLLRKEISNGFSVCWASNLSVN